MGWGDLVFWGREPEAGFKSSRGRSLQRLESSVVHGVGTQRCQQGDLGSDLPCDPWAVASILQSSFFPSVKWILLRFLTSVFFLGVNRRGFQTSSDSPALGT